MMLLRCLALWWAATTTHTAVAQFDATTCFTNFTDLMAAIEAKNPFDFVTFFICPNTVIDVGTEKIASSGVFSDGERPLLMRQFTKVFCGEDGSSSNNCTVRGGKNQVKVDFVAYSGEEKQGMEIKGFTFENSVGASLLTVYPSGDLLVQDCIYRNLGGEVLWASVADDLSPDITFDRCTFHSTTLSASAGGGLFVVKGQTKLSITNSVFYNNSFAPAMTVRPSI
jgi:hypothetical protein